MPRFHVFAARDGNALHEEIEAEDYEAAENEGRRLAAAEFSLEEVLQQAIDDDEVWFFDGELDGLLIEEIAVFLDGD